MAVSKKLAVVGRDCVACGSCERVCPMGAIKVAWGIAARVNGDKCVGCGKCAKACPAAVIEVVERSGVQ